MGIFKGLGLEVAHITPATCHSPKLNHVTQGAARETEVRLTVCWEEKETDFSDYTHSSLCHTVYFKNCVRLCVYF